MIGRREVIGRRMLTKNKSELGAVNLSQSVQTLAEALDDAEMGGTFGHLARLDEADLRSERT